MMPDVSALVAVWSWQVSEGVGVVVRRRLSGLWVLHPLQVVLLLAAGLVLLRRPVDSMGCPLAKLS